MQPGASQELSDTLVADRRDQGRQILHKASHEVREAMDGRRRDLDERLGPIVVEAFHPSSNGGSSEEQASSDVSAAPGAGGPELKNLQPLNRGEVRPAFGRDPLEPSAHEVELALQERHLGLEAVVLARQANASNPTVDGPPRARVMVAWARPTAHTTAERTWVDQSLGSGTEGASSLGMRACVSEPRTSRRSNTDGSRQRRMLRTASERRQSLYVPRH